MIRIQFDFQHFVNQKYGGISRYFANIQSSLDRAEEFSYDRGVLFSENYYLKDVKFPLPRFAGELFLKKYKKAYKWNKNHSLKCIKKNDFNIFHPTYYDPYYVHKVKTPVIITVHDMIHEKFPQLFQMHDGTTFQKRVAFEHASHFIAISESTKRDLQEFYNIADNRITVIHHGYTPLEGASDNSVNPYGNYLLYVGDRNNYKNFINFIHAASSILLQYKDIDVLCAGGGGFTSVESEIIYRYGLKERFKQLSVSDSELKGLYNHAMVYVNPSMYEGFGLPLLEAFSSSCPVVASNTSCFPEVCGNAAIFCNPNDPQSIRDAILSVIFNSKLCHTLKVNGEQQLGKFPMETCMQKTLATYKKVAQLY